VLCYITNASFRLLRSMHARGIGDISGCVNTQMGCRIQTEVAVNIMCHLSIEVVFRKLIFQRNGLDSYSLQMS
jgi:hypothetical protein